jgi:transcription elongation factor Elf1
VAGKGAVIVGQDGTTVKYRKKCTTCGHEDSSWRSIPITRGTTRVSYFCPKCRRTCAVEIHGHVN